MRSAARGIASTIMRAGQEQVIPADSLDLVDWSAVYLDLLQFKQEKAFWNLVIQPDMPRKLMAHEAPRLYTLIADSATVRPANFAGTAALQDTVLAILHKYVEKYYRVCQERWDSANMVYGRLTASDPNFRDYTVRIPRTEAELIAAVKSLIDEGNRIYSQDTQELPNIHFDRHLYQPLLVERGDKIKSDPPGLKPSEQRFVSDLRQYVRDNGATTLANSEVFLLRNLSRGRGIGFFENEGFYPDFILWVKQGDRQAIIFIEPHGMLMEKAYWTSAKTRLHERLAELSKAWSQAPGTEGVTLDSFIISATPYDTLREYYGEGDWSRERFVDSHVLFLKEQGPPDYCQHLFGGPG
jgi:hypothetical protein